MHLLWSVTSPYLPQTSLCLLNPALNFCCRILNLHLEILFYHLYFPPSFPFSCNVCYRSKHCDASWSCCETKSSLA